MSLDVSLDQERPSEPSSQIPEWPRRKDWIDPGAIRSGFSGCPGPLGFLLGLLWEPRGSPGLLGEPRLLLGSSRRPGGLPGLLEEAWKPPELDIYVGFWRFLGVFRDSRESRISELQIQVALHPDFLRNEGKERKTDIYVTLRAFGNLEIQSHLDGVFDETDEKEVLKRVYSSAP